MPIPIEVHKEQAVQLLDRLVRGEGVTPPDGRWRVADLLQLAGACLLTASSQWPAVAQSDQSPEELEETHLTLIRDLAGAAQFLAGRVFRAMQVGHYDLHFDDPMVGLVYPDLQVVPVILRDEDDLDDAVEHHDWPLANPETGWRPPPEP